MLSIILIGTALTAATVVIHATGTIWWVNLIRRDELKRRSNVTATKTAKQGAAAERRINKFEALRVLCSATITLVILHVLEVIMWAVMYLWLPNEKNLSTVEEAVYFSMVTLTSLGYGDVVIDSNYRLLSGIQAMAGMLVFGWSSALLFAALMRLLQLSDPEFFNLQNV